MEHFKLVLVCNCLQILLYDGNKKPLQAGVKAAMETVA